MTFIRLTRLDGRPIWLNASFVVTVESRRDGGAVVVPVGDGLDYDVRESPEAVLSLLGDVAAPVVVPVPTTDALKTSTKDEVEETPAPKPQEAEKADKAEPAKETGAEKKAPARKSAAKKKTTRKAASEKPAPAEEPKAEEKPQEPPAEETILAHELSDDEVDRLRKLAPRSVRKLRNTLTAQFDAPDINATIRALELRGVLAVERDHVIWK